MIHGMIELDTGLCLDIFSTRNNGKINQFVVPYRGTGWSILVLKDSQVLDAGRRKVLWVIEVHLLPFVELNSYR